MTRRAAIGVTRTVTGAAVAVGLVAAFGLVGAGSMSVPTASAVAPTPAPVTAATQIVTRASSSFQAITPARSMDTRSGQGGARFGPSETRTVSLAHLVPAGATAVSLNVTAVGASADTFLTVWPAGSARPDTSNLNLVAGDTRPNAVLVGLGPDRSIALFNAFGAVDVLVDVMGYWAGGFTGVRPQRVMDTRTGLAGDTLAPGAERRVQVAGVAGVPADASAVAVNVTAAGARDATFLTLWPTGTSMPQTSNVNAGAGSTVANLAVVGVGANGQISVGNGTGGVDAIVDVLGWFDRRGSYVPATPQRVLDTRNCGIRVGPGETRRIVLGSTSSTAHVVNVTAVGATTPTHLTVSPAGRPIASTSNLNPGDARPVANTVIVGSGDQGAVDIYNHAGYVHLIVDLFGSFGAPGSPAPPEPCLTIASSGVERQLLDAVNAYRTSNGRTPVAPCPTLDLAARRYAVVIASTGVLSHTGPDGSTLASRVLAAGYGSTYVGENLARGQADVTSVMRAWIDSSGHRANLLSADYEHLGVGVVDSARGMVWVLIFGAGGSCG